MTTHDRFFDVVHYTLQTRPNDLDPLNHVNNAVVLEYFEAARWDWAQHMQIDLRDTVVVVSRAEVDYLAEILPGSLRVSTRFIKPAPDWQDEDNYQAEAEQSISEAKSGRVLARARIKVAFLSARTRSLTTLQSCLLSQQRELQAQALQ